MSYKHIPDLDFVFVPICFWRCKLNFCLLKLVCFFFSSKWTCIRGCAIIMVNKNTDGVPESRALLVNHYCSFSFWPDDRQWLMNNDRIMCTVYHEKVSIKENQPHWNEMSYATIMVERHSNFDEYAFFSHWKS